MTQPSLGDATAIQTARLRRAWTACRVYFQQVEQDRSKVALADLDSLLQDSELRDVKAQFWKRYRLRFPADVHPSDAVTHGCPGSCVQADALSVQHLEGEERSVPDGVITTQAQARRGLVH